MRSSPATLLVCLLGAALPAAFCADAGLRLDNPVVADVPAAFGRVGGAAARIGIWTRGVIAYPFYSFNQEHDFGDNHFQGIQRLRAGDYLVISGSNIASRGDLTRFGLPQPAGLKAMAAPHGDLFIARLASRPARGPWGSNLDRQTGRPDDRDRLQADIPLSIPLLSGTRLWHPGGVSAVGDVLVVPLENYRADQGEICSRILFYDVSRPEQPRLLPCEIDRTTLPVKDKAGAATMIRLPDGRFLVASRTTTHVSFYLSRSIRLDDGFGSRPTGVIDEWSVQARPGLPWARFKGSSIHLLKQADGQLFMVGFRVDRGDPAKGLPPLEVASLWRLDFPRGDYRAAPTLTRIADRALGEEVLGAGGWGDFGAAVGIYVTEKGEIAIYTAARWQTDRPGHPTPPEMAAGRYARPADADFIPMAELWPR